MRCIRFVLLCRRCGLSVVQDVFQTKCEEKAGESTRDDGRCGSFRLREFQDGMKCSFDGHCEITSSNRHACSFCRLGKCLAMGMRSDLLRGTLPVRKSKEPVRSTPPALRFPTMNLLQTYQSTLTIDQWNDLSNIIHCYDEFGHLAIAERFLMDQNKLPLKMRFKTQSVQDAVVSLMSCARSLFEKNSDFLSLPRSIATKLISKTLKQICGFGTAFV